MDGDERALWDWFTGEALGGTLAEEDVAPHDEALREPMVRIASELGARIPAARWGRVREVHRVDDFVHYLVDLGDADEPAVFCFTLRRQRSEPRLVHVESVFIRLDHTPSPPTSRFPDVADGTKEWIREELRLSRDVRVFRMLVEERGEERAFAWFRDGAGFVLAARTWVPFAEVERAFVLYACWEQAQLRGNEVVLEALDDDRAEIHIVSNRLAAYERTAHLRQQIERDAFRTLFETPWRDRAREAGWRVRFDYGAGGEVTLRLSR